VARETNILLKELAPNLASAADSATALKRIREVIENEHHDWDQLDSKMEILMEGMKEGMKVKDARYRRNESLESMQIDDDKVKFFEIDVKPEGIGQGTYGVVHRVKYERNIVAAKTIDLRNIPQTKIESTRRNFTRRLH